MPEMNLGEFSHWAIENVRSFLPEAYKKAEIDLYPVAKNDVFYTAMTVRLIRMVSLYLQSAPEWRRLPSWKVRYMTVQSLKITRR